MAIARKPKSQEQVSEADVNRLINKGGSVVAERQEESEYLAMTLRIPVEMMPDIKASIKRRRPVRISRHQWIIEAMQEKLLREES